MAKTPSNRVIFGSFIAANLLATLGGCSAADLDDQDGRVLEGPSDESTLKLGDRGPAVVKATAFFNRSGYFENDELRSQYPSWRPIAGRPPEDAAVFGNELEHAVRAYQARSNLPVTGRIDAATRAVMDARFCGVPDSLESDVGEKWTHDTFMEWQDHTDITYSITIDPTDNTGGLTAPQVRSVIDGAFRSWDSKVNLNFRRIDDPNLADIDISFIDLSDPFLGIGRREAIFIDNNSGWGTSRLNLSTVVAHEIGHSIGLAHSSEKGPNAQPPLMDAAGDNDGGILRPVAPTTDELLAVAASPYTTFVDATAGVSGTATDIGSSTSGGTEYTWKLGTGIADSHGFKIFRWRGADWQQINGGAARIDVAGMVPWVIDNSGRAFRKTGVTASNPNGTGWDNRGDCDFVDIGANKNGVVWALGGSINSRGDYQVYRYDGATGTGCNTSTSGSRWRLVSGNARYIDVAEDGSPWVVVNGGGVFHRKGVSAGTPDGTDWDFFGGNMRDVSVGPDHWGTYGPVFFTARSADSLVYIYNFQVAATGVDGRDEFYATWSDTQATFLSVGRDGLPWIVGTDGLSKHRTP
jgi:peptidoglycan hydrolase-like protein with peptidoglycan-binding domain